MYCHKSPAKQQERKKERKKREERKKKRKKGRKEGRKKEKKEAQKTHKLANTQCSCSKRICTRAARSVIYKYYTL